MKLLFAAFIVLAELASLKATFVHYHIVPENSTALCQYYHNGTCFTLDHLRTKIKNSGTNITISFLSGDHRLTWNMTLNYTVVILNSELSAMTVTNRSSKISRIICRPYTQIAFIEINLFILHGLVIQGCRNSGNGGAIYLKSVQLATIVESYFVDNQAIRGGAIYSTQTDLTIQNSTFIHNLATSGGVIAVRSGNCSITNSHFVRNQATLQYTYGENNGGAIHIYSDVDHTCIADTEFIGNKALKSGGAISNNLQGTTRIMGCSFKNNSATSGGAISTISSLLSTNNVFQNNTARNGGAIYIDLYDINAEVVFSGNTTLSNNTGMYGGAIRSAASKIVFLMNSTVVISHNIARHGGAIYLEQSIIHVNNVQTIQIVENTAQRSGGGIYAFQTLIEIQDVQANVKYCSAYIAGNMAKNGSGMYLSASSFRIALQRNLVIYNNSATQYGGGVYVEQRSRINIQHLSSAERSKVFAIVSSNKALRGGGVFVLDSASGLACEGINSSSDLHSKECFLQTAERFSDPGSQIMILFVKNKATEIGNDIYGGLLDRCLINPSAPKHPDGTSYLQKIAGFDWAGNDTVTSAGCLTDPRVTYGNVAETSQFFNHVSSDPVRICFCTDIHLPDCYNKHPHPTVSVKKGETFTLSVVAVDQVGRPVNAMIISSLHSENRGKGRLKEGQQHRRINNNCTELKYNLYSDQNLASLEVNSIGPCGNEGISKQQVNIAFKPCSCPIGLEILSDPIDCLCDCANELKQYISSCSPENGTIQVNQNVWIKYINNTNFTSHFIAHSCPFDYFVKKPVNISLANQTEADKQCAFNRTGMLCGKCTQGLSLVFGSTRCLQCSNYYLFLIVPLAIAGIALVAFILLLNMTVATGTIHGLIFYVNILAANRSIFLLFDTPNFLTVFISWLNLDLGIETCFYEGMDSYGKFLLQLVFPAYVFTLIAIIMLWSNCSQPFARIIGKRNPEATLYMLILLSYSKLIQIIITALEYATISYPNGTQKLVWMYDANVLYLDVKHIPRFLIAILIFIFGTIYTILLLFGQLFNRYSQHRIMKWTTHKYYIHFMNAHHASLSDKHCYWLGLLLLSRLVYYLISAFADESIVIFFVGTLSFALLLYKQNKQVYTKWAEDLLETISITNLGMLALTTFYIKFSLAGGEISRDQQALATVSMALAFIVFLCIVFYHVLEMCGIKLSQLPNKILTVLRWHQHYQPVPIRGFAEDNNHGTTQYSTSTPFIRPAVPEHQLREPALDELSPVRPEDYDPPLAVPQPRRREIPTHTNIDIRSHVNYV